MRLTRTASLRRTKRGFLFRLENIFSFVFMELADF